MAESKDWPSLDSIDWPSYPNSFAAREELGMRLGGSPEAKDESAEEGHKVVRTAGARECLAAISVFAAGTDQVA